MKNFILLPSGVIKNGTVSYDLDASGNVIYSVAAKVGVAFFSKNVSAQGTYKVDPSLLLSANVWVGEDIKIGDVECTVTSISGTIAMADISIPSQNAKGTASISLANPQIELLAADATAKAFGFNLTIQVRPAPAPSLLYRLLGY